MRTLVSLIAAIGKRGQIAFDGVIPWENKEDLKHFALRTRGSVMIAGERTYKQVHSQLELTTSKRELLCWSPAVGDPVTFINRVKTLFTDRPIWIIGGAYTYEAFYPCINHELDIAVLDWDNDPVFDAQATFFPIDLYGLRDRIKP